MSKIALIVAITLAAGSTAAQAVLVNASTAELLSFRYCIVGITPCDDLTDAVQLDYGGSPGATASTAGNTVVGLGSAAGSVSLSGTIGAPILMASASSDPGARVSTNSVALQSYTYTGTEASTRTFGATLTYSQTLSGIYPAGNGISAAMDLFTLSASKVDVGSTPESNFQAIFIPSSFPDYSSLGYQDYSDDASTTAGSALLGVTVTLQPGETVWVWLVLQTPAANGSVVDASHTLLTSWDNPLNLVPAAVVPEPATGSLLLLGLAGFALCGRRMASVDSASRSRQS